jgi:CRP-like cAMP-binding protein
VITTFGVGTPFGVAAFVRGSPRTATIRAATDLLLFVLQRPAWQAILEHAAASVASRADGPVVEQIGTGQANRPAGAEL